MTRGLWPDRALSLESDEGAAGGWTQMKVAEFASECGSINAIDLIQVVSSARRPYVRPCLSCDRVGCGAFQHTFHHACVLPRD